MQLIQGAEAQTALYQYRNISLSILSISL
ncbi:hypothetical protein Nmel_011628 [Mimus melanotis]